MEFYLWVYTVIKNSSRYPRSKCGIKIREKYNDWLNKFNTNPEDYIKQIENKAITKTLRQLEQIVSPEILKLVEAQLLSRQSEPAKINRDIQKKFSNLIIGKVIGYSGRILYRELSRRL
jgi:predicted transglutaminase-like protease